MSTPIDVLQVGGRPPVGDAKKVLEPAAAGLLTNGRDLNGRLLHFPHLQPPKMRLWVLLNVEVNHDKIAALAGDYTHIVAVCMDAVLAVPPLESQIRCQFVLKITPFGQGRPLPRFVFLGCFGWHHLPADFAVHCGVVSRARKGRIKIKV